MKLANFNIGGEIRLGIKSNQGIIDVEKTAAINSFDTPITMKLIIESGDRGLLQLNELIKKELVMIPEEQAVYAPCINNPEKILCIGLNYKSHRDECNLNIPEFPVVFSKFNNALAAHNQIIKLPQTAEKYDYEAELVIVIGKEAKNISKEDAFSYVFGYTVGNDVSARDLQLRTEQWLLGKTCDNFAPIGPYIVTADEVNPNSLTIICEVNGEIRQFANTCDMIFDCSQIVSYISQYMTLKPGDIIFTGTPSGVILGYPESNQHWLKSGDIIKISIEPLGTLINILE